MDVRVVAGQQLADDPDGGHLLGPLVVAGLPVAERQPEPLAPVRPGLLHPRQPGDVVVLDPGQVPEQPAAGVRLRVGPLGRGLLGQPVGQLLHQLRTRVKESTSSCFA